MEPEAQTHTDRELRTCPECGSEETGYFCRICGTLLRGEEMVLCPRCHHIVPDGEFCNQCGQGLGGIALQLKQLSLAGDMFWVTSEDAAARLRAEPAEILAPDESVALAKGEIPGWLEELNATRPPPKAVERVYPALSPIREEHRSGGGNLFIALVIVLFVVMLALVALALAAALSVGA